MKKVILLAFGLIICSYLAVAQITYPDNNLPADTPLLFAKDIVSTGLANRDFTTSPTGDELFYTIQHPKFIASVIIRLTKVNGKWGKPEVAPFSGVFRDLEASFSPDGKTLFFSSDRQLTGNQPKRDFDIWKVSKTANGNWGQPENLGPTINTAKNEFYPSVARSGNLYFTVEAPYGKGGEDIVVCSYTASGYQAPVSLSEGVNTQHGEFNAFVDPDEQFILFTSDGRADDKGKGDIYISKKDKTDNWLPATHLPGAINSTSLDYCPYVTPDKKYLIFTSNRLRKEWYNEKAATYAELDDLLSGPGNGQDDIYWVKFNLSAY
jgi:Tol biopolymer transport system component